MEAVADKF